MRVNKRNQFAQHYYELTMLKIDPFPLKTGCIPISSWLNQYFFCSSKEQQLIVKQNIEISARSNIQQLLNEAEQDMKNSADQIMEFWRSPTEICRILHILRKLNSIITLLFTQNISPFLKEFRHFALCFSTHQNNTTLSPGFLGQRFNNLQRATLLTSLA